MSSREQRLVAELGKLVKSAEGNKPCKLCVALEKLAPEGRVALQKVVAMRDQRGRAMFSARKLYPILRAADLDVTYASIETHRQEGHK